MKKIENVPCSYSTEDLDPSAAGTAVNQGCAFRGAKLALQPITDVAHLVHGPITCQGHSWFVRPTASSGSLLHRSTFITDLGEMDIIYGGEEKLARAIADIVSCHDPAAVFVYQTCLPAMIGDDISAVCKSMGARYCRPVIAVDAPGFAGGKDFGSEFAGKVLIEQVIGSREPEISTDFDIVLIGEYNVAGSVESIRSLFGRLGIRILASIPGDGRYHDIAASHRARTSLSLCSRAMVNMSGHQEDRFGLPGISGCLYGIANTSRTLINVAALLARQSGKAGFFKQARALIVEQELDARRQLAPFRKRLRGKRALIMGGGTKTWALITALEEIGLSVIGSMLHKTSVNDCRLAKETAARRKVHLFEDISEERLEILLRQEKIDVLFCGIGYSFAANRAGVAWVDIQHHRTTSLTGYDGLIRLAEEIDRVCHSPVFARVRLPGPWMENFATICRPRAPGWKTAMQEAFSRKSYQANPLKISRPMGAALALLGMGNTVPLMLGARGCAMVGLIQLNRHFQRPLPIETVALDEVSFISGTTDVLEHTLLELSSRPVPPGLVGLLATGMVEASGNDVAGFLGDFHRRQQRLHPECAAMDTVLVTCPDFTGASPDGWCDTVEAVIGQYAVPSKKREPRQITVLAGWQMNCGDLEEIKDILEAFDLTPLVIPDLSITDPAGGPALLNRLGASTYTLAFGEHIRGAAQILEQRTGIPFKLFDRYVGLDAGDELMQVLARISGRQTPVRFRRRRNRLVETMLNVAPMFSGRKIALAGDPDHLFSLYCWLSELGAHLHCGIAAGSTPILQQMPEGRIQIGDLEDLEKAAQGADLLIAPSGAAPVARRLGIPHLRAGVPVTDRLESAWQTTLGYRGAWNFLCTAADLINDHQTQFVQS